jgi:hypothetical protein
MDNTTLVTASLSLGPVIATRADTEITDPPSRIRVTDRFMITPEGKIIQQENHYDPKGGPADLKSAF